MVSPGHNYTAPLFTAFLDELTNDPGQEEDEDSDCETEDDNARQDVHGTENQIIRGSYCGP